MSRRIHRRVFLKSNAAALTGVTLGGLLASRARGAENTGEPLRIGVAGTGRRGRSLMTNLLALENVAFPAVCDIDPEAVAAARKIVIDQGLPRPEGYTGETDYEKMMERDDLDAVIIASPWDLHAPMSVYGMKAGKVVGCEVPIAYTLEECWELIDTHEKTGTPCMQLENWSFRADNLAVLKMIRQGLLGEISYAHCAYSHDCIDHWYFAKGTGDSRWGAKYLIEHNRCQYPTHQQGPVLSWMNINRGDCYDTLTSTATDCFSIYDFFKRNYPDHPNGKRKYKQGDIVTTVVRTQKGKTIVINFDMQSPRPYDNRWTVQGTRGLYNEQRESVYIVGRSPEYHEWEPFAPYQEQFEHGWANPATAGLVDREGHLLSFVGHGGADGIMLHQFVRAVREKKPLPLDLYDGVLMASIGPLSEMSIADSNRPIQVPDFTRGGWKTAKPYFALET